MALVIALEFASHTALGYDPTIERIRHVDSKAVYHIKVHVEPKPRRDDISKFRLFEMEDLLSDTGAEAFHGRGTRVWTVRGVVDGKPAGHLMVLKDCFINEDRPREGDTTMEIVGALPKGDKHRLHFLTVVVHGDVVVDDRPDTTDVIHHDQICPPSLPCIDVGAIFNQLGSSPLFYAVAQSDTSTDNGSGNLPFVLPAVPAFAPTRSNQSRQHYRIVFKEVGKAVSSMKNHKDMFLAIQGALTGSCIFLFLQASANFWSVS